jgi:hypothetical protein
VEKRKMAKLCEISIYTAHTVTGKKIWFLVDSMLSNVTTVESAANIKFKILSHMHLKQY